MSRAIPDLGSPAPGGAASFRMDRKLAVNAFPEPNKNPTRPELGPIGLNIAFLVTGWTRDSRYALLGCSGSKENCGGQGW